MKKPKAKLRIALAKRLDQQDDANDEPGQRCQKQDDARDDEREYEQCSHGVNDHRPSFVQIHRERSEQEAFTIAIPNRRQHLSTLYDIYCMML
jgi:hypothetical protein